MSDSSFQANKTVFLGSSFLISLVTGLGALFPVQAGFTFDAIQDWLIAKTSWFYIASVATILFFAFWLIFSRLGDIRLGPNDAKPEYGFFAWFSMLFSAGMGIGLLFFGVAEPMMHFSSPPVGDPFSISSAKEAMKITFFHWGLHAWAIYSTLAVTLAYFCYRRGLPLLPRSAMYPFIGEKINGRIGDLVDIFAIVGTLFGVGTSLGLGVSQVNAGLDYMFGVEQSVTMQMLLIGVITGFATISVVLGLDKGIKRLSYVNVILASLLLVFVLFAGSTIDLLQAYVQNTGAYLSDIVYKTFNLYTYQKKQAWIGGWTLLYWGWWVSWAPFVGIFIARISRGRTIREFMAGVLFVPTAFIFLWMTVFGNSAIEQTLADPDRVLAGVVSSNVPLAIFKFFEGFPATGLMSFIALILVITFFVSSSDSGSLVIDTLASGGSENPPVWQRVYWACLEGLVAAILLLAGGLGALQTMTIASAFPLIFLIFLGCVGLIQTLQEDHMLSKTVALHQTAVQYERANTTWRQRLNVLLTFPRKSRVSEYISGEAKDGLSELKDEMVDKGLDVELRSDAGNSVKLVVSKDELEDFSYEVRLQTSDSPSYADSSNDSYARAEVYLIQGGQGYDVYGYSKDQIIADAITQYEKHLHYLHMTDH
ncbi:MAG: BCCT family transporter [Bdellovibrionales bacterium]|nr:BCCT family transporter [Bdellovibrionales bacterium]